MYQTILNFLNCGSSKKLCLLTCPTGFGKSFEVRHLIQDEVINLCDNKDSLHSKIIYITPLKSNCRDAINQDVIIKNLRKNKSNGDRYVKYFLDNYIFLQPIHEVVTDFFDKNKDSLIISNSMIYNCDEFKALKQIVQFKDTIKQGGNTSAFTSTLAEAEQAFRWKLKKLLREASGENEAKAL